MPSPKFIAAFTFAASIAAAALPAHAQVTVTEAWVRGTVAGQQSTGAFMELKSATDSALVGVASPAAKVVELHEMKMDGGVMKMKAIERLPLPAGQAVALKPGGYHVMLMGLVQPLAAGGSVPVTLTFEDKTGKKQTMDVSVPVRALTAGAPAK
jgi:copper(I)-binding protein